MRPRRRHRARATARCARGGGGVLPLVLAAVIVALGWWGTPAHRRPDLAARGALVLRNLRGWLDGTPAAVVGRLAPPRAVSWIDPADLDAEAWREGLAAYDERWADELLARLAEVPAFASDAPDVGARLDALRAALEELSFVRSVPVCGLEPTGPEPDAESELVLELELRTPAACLPVSGRFHCVDAEGVVLSGAWPVPPYWRGAPLPVIGPIEDGRGLFSLVQPGDWLAETEHLDALDVARSLAEHLDRDERRGLGRLVIDARAARRASVEEAGVVLLLEGRRMVLFGRAPSTDEPGELAVARKWTSLRRALDARGTVDDWDVVDVRWDDPELVLRAPLLAHAVSDGGRAGTGVPR